MMMEQTASPSFELNVNCSMYNVFITLVNGEEADFPDDDLRKRRKKAKETIIRLFRLNCKIKLKYGKKYHQKYLLHIL